MKIKDQKSKIKIGNSLYIVLVIINNAIGRVKQLKAEIEHFKLLNL